MPDVTFSFRDVPAFGRLMKDAAPEHALRAIGRAMFLIGKSDIAKMKSDQLSGGTINIKSKRFANSFKFKATDSRQVKSIDQLQLSEYTGARPFRIFQDGGIITPNKSRLLTILTDAARTSSGQRKFSQKELSALIASGAAKVIQTKAGPCIIKVDPATKRIRNGAKSVILAWLKPAVKEQKRIDFFKNFESNLAVHSAILEEAANNAIEQTENDDEFDGL